MPLSFAMLPELAADYPLTRNEQAGARGLRLEEKFLAGVHVGAEFAPESDSA